MSTETRSNYSESDWPLLRNSIVSLMGSARPNVIGASLELDVTDAITAINRIQRRLRIALSLHAYLVFCLSRASQAVESARTYRRGTRRLLTFEDVNIATPLEKRLRNGTRVPVAYVVRAAQGKSLARITAELRLVTKSADLADDPAVRQRRQFSALPRLLRKWLADRVTRDPLLLNKVYGNTAITSVLRGGRSFPVFPHIPTIHTVSVAVGSQCERLRMAADGRVERRQVLCVTVMADHDVVDGMPLLQFCHVLEGLAASATGLDEEFTREIAELLEPEQSGGRDAKHA